MLKSFALCRLAVCSFVCALFAAGLTPMLSAAEAADSDGGSQTHPVKALMITGGCCHDYENQKRLISEGLSQRVGPIDWTILEYGDKKDTRADIYERGDWSKGFDIVVHNECFGGVTDPQFVAGIVAAHTEHDVPAIVVHCSMHSYRAASNADVWREFLGVTSRRHERKKGSMKVEATEAGKQHSILAPMGDSWKTPNGELYIIENVWPNTEVLATAHSDETGNDEPVIWTNELDGSRVFGISLGHHNETIQAEQWQAIVANGWKWALQK